VTTVRRASAADIPVLAAVLARAFARDPYHRFLAGDAPERNQRMRDGWSALLRHSSNRLSDTWTTDSRAGVAVWHPPGYDGPSFLDSLRLLPSVARLAGSWRRLRAISRAVSALEARRRGHVARPHYYLSVLGVDPDRQGEGIGTALLEPTLAAADHAGVPAYAESAIARSVLLYERLGFEVVEELTLPGTDIHGWLMVRNPSRGGEVV